MDPGARILLALEARDCFPALRGTADVHPSAREPVLLHPRTATFGTTLLGKQNKLDLKNIAQNWATRMAGLSDAYVKFAPVWQQRDPAAFADFTSDWTGLQNRYAAAMKTAQAVIDLWTPIPDSQLDCQAAYDGLAKAMRQCYPPDGCPTAKGDFQDLYQRLSAAQEAPVYIAPMVQPDPSADTDLTLFKATKDLDVIASATGLQKPPTWWPSWLQWLIDHKIAVITGAGVLIGGVLILNFLPLILGPIKAMKVAAAAAV